MSLTELLITRIKQHGPLSIADYMQAALTHPDYGYYTSKDPLGEAGDFTTAPEISQMFGEMLGAWCVAAWHQMGKPEQLTLIECGPGRGTLMHDMLRTALQLAPSWQEGLEVQLVEVSTPLKAIQQHRLEPQGVTMRWLDRLESLPDSPTIVIANEFLDALPIRQWVRGTEGWHERLVDMADDGSLCFTTAATPDTPPLAPTHAAPGDVYEYCHDAHEHVGMVARHASSAKLAALYIDYGYSAREHGDSLQAVRAHAHHPVLQAPGSADLTAHVDCMRLCDTAMHAGAAIHGPVSQATFLNALGIGSRAASLAQKATAAQQHDIYSALHRLTAPEEMGRLFKAFALSSPSLGPLPGFYSRFT